MAGTLGVVFGRSCQDDCRTLELRRKAGQEQTRCSPAAPSSFSLKWWQHRIVSRMEFEIVPPESLPLRSADHESFAQAVAAGTPAALAYRDHCSDVSRKTSWEQASRLLRKVGARVNYLRKEAAKV